MERRLKKSLTKKEMSTIHKLANGKVQQYDTKDTLAKRMARNSKSLVLVALFLGGGLTKHYIDTKRYNKLQEDMAHRDQRILDAFTKDTKASMALRGTLLDAFNRDKQILEALMKESKEDREDIIISKPSKSKSQRLVYGQILYLNDRKDIDIGSIQLKEGKTFISAIYKVDNKHTLQAGEDLLAILKHVYGNTYEIRSFLFTDALPEETQFDTVVVNQKCWNCSKSMKQYTSIILNSGLFEKKTTT